MSDESYTFTAARARLDVIVSQVRKKDVSLEASLDLLEEGVKLANQCTELIDQVDWVTAQESLAARAAGDEAEDDAEPDDVAAGTGSEAAGAAADGVAAAGEPGFAGGEAAREIAPAPTESNDEPFGAPGS